MSICTRKESMMIAGVVKKNAPILELINTELQGEFKSGGGTTIDVQIPGYGVVTKGEAIGDATVEVAPVPVTVDVYNTAASLTMVQKALDVDDFQKQIAEPRGAKLASTVNKLVYEEGFYNANQSVVTSAVSFPNFAEAVSDIESTRVDGSIGAMIHPIVKARLASSDNDFDNPSISKDLYNGVIGDYMGATFVSSPDASIVYTSWVPGSAAAVSAVSEGATSLVITDATAVSGSVCKKGTVLKIAGIRNVDEFGDALATQRSFVVKEDFTVTSAGTVTVSVEAIHAVGPLKNVSALPTAGLKVTSPLEASSSYYTGIVFSRNSLMFGSAPLKEFYGSDPDETMKLAGVINVRFAADGNITSGAQVARWDILAGTKTVRGKAICNVYVKA